MNEAVTSLQRIKQGTLFALLGIHVVMGYMLASGMPTIATPEDVQAALATINQSPISLVDQVLVRAACLVWVECDSRQLVIRRPWWLTLGIVLFPLIFVAYYLYKTRQPGLRAQAILAFVAIALANGFVMAFGMVMGMTTGVPAVPTSQGL